MKIIKINILLVFFTDVPFFISQEKPMSAREIYDALAPTKGLSGSLGSIRSVAWSPNGTQLLASGSCDTTVRLCDVGTGQEKALLQGHTDWVRSVAWSPDGNQLASGSSDRTIRLWDTKTGRERAVRLWDVITRQKRAVLSGHRDSVRSVTYSPDGTQLASGSRDTTVRLWHVRTGQKSCIPWTYK